MAKDDVKLATKADLRRIECGLNKKIDSVRTELLISQVQGNSKLEMKMDKMLEKINSLY